MKILGKTIRYNLYQLLLDIYGAISIVILVIYWFKPDWIKMFLPMDAAEEGMFANVLSELIGIYISVRLIDLIIRRNETRDRVRVRTVRVARSVERMVANVIMHKNYAEVDRLRRELKWVERIQQKRNKWLSKDEIRDLKHFYSLVEDFCKYVPGFERTFGTDRFELDVEYALKQLTVIENARFTAEENILEETEEDAGM
jgi:hypothetical protein